MPAAAARWSARASSRELTTWTISIGSSAWWTVSMRLCRFEPLPDTSTLTR
jgi:hypothetical protein